MTYNPTNTIWDEIRRSELALWSALNGVAAGIGALLGGLILRHIDSLSALLPLITGNEIKTVFVITTLCRLLALLHFFIREKVMTPTHEPLPYWPIWGRRNRP